MPNIQTNTSDNFEPLPPETELLIWHLASLSGRLKEHDRHYSIMELYDDLPIRAYLMMEVLDELRSKNNNQFQNNNMK